MRGFSEALLLVAFTLLPSVFVNGQLLRQTSSFKPVRRSTVLRGLLVPRQGQCASNPGFVECEATGCCPVGWNCCRDGTCCGPTTYCDLASNGNIGCCDNGKICSGPVGGPSTINVPPPTQTLPPPQPGSPTAATPPAITTAASASAKVTSSNILTLPKPTITATATQAIAPIPTAAVAQIPDKSTVDSTAPVIQYQGIWTQANSSCDSTVSSMKTQDPLSYLSYRFKVSDNGQVYMGSSRNQDAGVFVVALDNVQTEIDGFSATAENSCSFTWSQINLSKGYHNLTVSYVGTSPQSQAQGQSGSFELNNFQLVGQDTSPVQSGGMSIHGGVSSSAVTVFFAGLLQVGLFLA